MIKRREFNKLALASAVFPFVTGSVALEQNDSHRDKGVNKYFIYEEGFGDMQTVLPELASYKKIYKIKGDVTWVWYHELHHLWKNKGIIIAGLTRESEFFVLNTLARDYGYRTVYQKSQRQRPFLSWVIASVEFGFT